VRIQMATTGDHCGPGAALDCFIRVDESFGVVNTEPAHRGGKGG
jgi:hypothetical protein